MEYALPKNTPPRPKSSYESYLNTTKKAIDDFTKDNRTLDLIVGGKFSIEKYHSLLTTIFHQVYFSSTSFALAGAMASNSSVPVRSYLIHHAEEEKDHWMWILEDLESTGYKGPDPRSAFPNWAAQAYLSYGVYLSFFNPVGRLAMANVLEGISGKFGLDYGATALKSLQIRKEQAKFFLMHGELDQGHTQDILDILKGETISPEQWADLENVAMVTSQLYKNLYNFAAGL